jgi:hypothetical protein
MVAAFQDKKHTISKIIFSKYTVGRRADKFSNNTKENLKMKTAIFNGLL